MSVTAHPHPTYKEGWFGNFEEAKTASRFGATTGASE